MSHIGKAMAYFKLWFLETRPHFLLLTPVSVFLGLAAALYDGAPFQALHFALALVGALLAHISVNVLNDYFDFKSGIDLRTRRTPFSGGSGILPAGRLSPRSVQLFGMGCLLALVPIGIYFWAQYGLAILPLGLLGMLVIYSYTTYITRVPWLCLIAPGLGFGPLMVLGVYFSQAGAYSLTAMAVSLVPGFLVSNLLLLNQFPDVAADASAQRRHFPIALGRGRSAWLYAGLLLATYAWILLAVAWHVLPPAALLGLVTLPVGWAAIRGVTKHYDDLDRLVPFLGRNVLVTLLTPLALGVGLVVSGLLI
ncbi:MAG: prenyltransferase [Chloroflexota bacterium]|nr:prenyltransferase [Chloroflexota bacterium]